MAISASARTTREAAEKDQASLRVSNQPTSLTNFLNSLREDFSDTNTDKNCLCSEKSGSEAETNQNEDIGSVSLNATSDAEEESWSPDLIILVSQRNSGAMNKKFLMMMVTTGKECRHSSMGASSPRTEPCQHLNTLASQPASQPAAHVSMAYFQQGHTYSIYEIGPVPDGLLRTKLTSSNWLV